MGKIKKAIRRADTIEDHVHELPDGSLTLGMNMKPNKDMSQMHSHLYECEEDTLETGPMHNEGDHVHTIKEGMTSGPKPMPKKPGEPWQEEKKIKLDSLQRIGREWVVRSSTGHTIAKGDKAQLKKDFPDAVET